MDRTKQIIISTLLFVGLIMTGSIGYMIIEGWEFMDSLYMTIITLATVGYGEVQQVSGPGRIFTMMLILLGGGYFLYLISDIFKFLVEGRIRFVLGRHKLDSQIKKLKDHYIICGYGRIGKLLTEYLVQKYIDVVIIEKDENRMDAMNEDGVLYIIGEAASETTLKRAGIEEAKGLIAVVATDAENVFLVLLAKQLNKELFVVARTTEDSSKKTLMAAGANKVISHFDIGARRIAHAILRPTVIKFLEMAFVDEKTDIQIEEIIIKPGAELADIKLVDSNIRKDLDLIIIAIQDKDKHMIFNPTADAVLTPGSTVVAMGCAKGLKKLEIMLQN